MYKFCSSPWETIAINEKGSISPCLCSRQHFRGYRGDLLTNDLKTTVNSAWMQEFKGSIIDQSYQFCDHDYCNLVHESPIVESLDIVNSMPELPTNLMLQIDKNCNLKCASCRNYNIYSPMINQAADRILTRLIEEYANFDQKVTVYCDGSGDVFASAAYQKFFRSTDLPACFKFAIMTNGNLITKNKDLYEKLGDQIDTTLITLDAATAETYKEVRGGNFDIVIDGIRMLKSMEKLVGLAIVVQKKNYHEVRKFYEIADQFGITDISVNLLERWPHMSDQWWQENSITTNPNIDLKLLLDDIEFLKERNPWFVQTLHNHNLI